MLKIITVNILINGKPIYTRSAVNITKNQKDIIHKYQNDDGSFIRHDPNNGAIVLAKKMLDTIKEVK